MGATSFITLECERMCVKVKYFSILIDVYGVVVFAMFFSLSDNLLLFSFHFDCVFLHVFLRIFIFISFARWRSIPFDCLFFFSLILQQQNRYFTYLMGNYVKTTATSISSETTFTIKLIDFNLNQMVYESIPE